MKMLHVAAVALGPALLAPALANADVVSYFGRDAGAGPSDPRPLSDAAAASFDATVSLLGGSQLVNFESLASGNFANLVVAPGITASLNSTDSDPSTFPGVSVGGDEVFFGYNTTSGGSKHLRVVPRADTEVTLTFSFATPIQGWGGYFSGLSAAPGKMFVEFTDGTNQTLNLTGSPDGGVLFYGFTDLGKTINTLSLRMLEQKGSRDIYGFDDMRVLASGVPEPVAASMLVLPALAMLRRRGR